MSFAISHGSRVWYETSGHGEPLALIGGFGIVQNQFDRARPYLDPHFTSVHWSFRGTGLSDWTQAGPVSVDGWADDLRAVLDAAGIERTHVWATSTGSAVGIRFAAKYPERVRSLITYPWFRSDEAWKDIFDTTWRVARSFGLFTLARVFAGVILPRHTLHESGGIDFENFETEAFERNINPRTLETQMRALMDVDLTGDVRRLQCPTLLLMGADSPLNAEDALKSASHDTLVREFVALRPDAQVVGIPDTGSTYCMITDPEKTCRYVREFVASLEAGK
jgi:pimeloyl-ACP methyl ester carboxylesterase